MDTETAGKWQLTLADSASHTFQALLGHPAGQG